MTLSFYRHGIKSFHKLLAKFKRQGFIGTICENKFSEQFIYPKEKLIKSYKRERWQNFALPDQNLDTAKLYWQIAKVCEWATTLKPNFESESYINDDGPYFDFRFDMTLKKRHRFGLYAYFPPGDDEQNYFKNLNKRISRGFLERPILFTRDWDVYTLRCLSEHYFKSPFIVNKVAWCHMKEDQVTRESILSAPLINMEFSTTLKDYVTKDVDKEIDPPKELEPTPGKNTTLWQSIKEVFH